MSFTSFDFLFFVPIITALYYIIPYTKRWVVLLAGSYFFYLSFKLEFIPWIVMLSAFVYVFALLLDKFQTHKIKKSILLIGIFVVIGFLILLKYNNFLFANLNYLVSFFRINLKPIELGYTTPLGISYFSFVMISYLLDVYNEKIKAERHPGKFAVYIAFFPKLIAGPIERAKDFIPQLSVCTDVKYENISNGAKLILLGFFKKVVIADRIAEVVNKVYGGMSGFSGLSILFVVFLYSFQLYADFSGYTDMARGIAKLFGFKLTENFKRPYLSPSISELWRRWHISLSNWLRDYIFLPLSYSITRKMMKTALRNTDNAPSDTNAKHSTSKTSPKKLLKPEYIAYISAIFITMTLCGLWHGASWNFIIWGTLQGIFLIIAFLFRRNKKKFLKKLPLNKSFRLILSIFFTYAFFSFSMIFFRADSFADALLAFKKIFTLESGIFITFKNATDLVSSLILIFSLIAVEIFLEFREKAGKIYELHKFINIPVALILLIIIFVFGKFLQTDFLYFKF